MSASQESQIRTRMFARVLGPFSVIACVTAVVRASDMRTLVSDFGANPLWPWVAGAFVLVGGLIIVALHQYWRSAAAVIVSLLGWLLVLRGLFLLAFPATFMSMANSVVGAGALWRTVCICFALIGLYLTYVGWMPAPSRPTSQAASSTTDLPRAA
ncbi:MAG: hypothetical protein JO045_03120 [Mycobacterium sp.]|nr:hypothetical protein [Mycobacterium sp.]